MRGKWKYILIVFLLIIVSILGYGVYIFKFKEYDVADPQVDEIVKDNYVLELPDGTSLTIDKDGKVIEENQKGVHFKELPSAENSENTKTDGLTTTDPGQDSSASTTKDSNKTDAVKQNTKPTVASIKEKYMPTFEALEAQASSRLSNLLSSAASEYSSKKSNGESVSVGYFYNKYSAAAKNLEANTDIAFYALISVIEKELEANGFATSHAQSFIDTYEAAKKARSEAILGKVKEFM